MSPTSSRSLGAGQVGWFSVGVYMTVKGFRRPSGADDDTTDVPADPPVLVHARFERSRRHVEPPVRSGESLASPDRSAPPRTSQGNAGAVTGGMTTTVLIIVPTDSGHDG